MTYCRCTLRKVNFVPGDVVIAYWRELANTSLFVQLPFQFYNTVYFWPEMYPNASMILINTTPDGTSNSPWTTNTTLTFRIVVIKATAARSVPKIDYNNYQEIKNITICPTNKQHQIYFNNPFERQEPCVSLSEYFYS